MITKFGFTLMTPTEFKTWIKQQNVARTVLFVQQHHTFLPSYQQFRGDNHFSIQSGMKNHHVHNNGWSDIGQQFSIFPDGMIATGRSLERSPACIRGNNANAICIENVGDFDAGKDQMTAQQRDSILTVTAALCKRFGIPVNTDRIVYHHWFDLNTGNRTNGTGSTKSCPGTNFFGGNTVATCQTNFLPAVQAKIGEAVITANLTDPMMYGYVTANALNIRKGASSSFAKIGVTTLGSILRIYLKKGRWYKISKSKEEWVYGNYVKQVKRATVNADVLNVRSGPSTSFHIVSAVLENQEVFIYQERDNWSRISLEQNWVSSRFLNK